MMTAVPDSESKEVIIVSEPIESGLLREVAEAGFGDMVKAVVDVARRVIAMGGDLHADEELVLLERGSSQTDLWGINIYPDKARSERVEFDSMINIRPRQKNRSRFVEDSETRELIVTIVDYLIP
jgi:hypothetical protein